MDWKFIGRTFGKGLVVVLPVVLTLYLLWWLAAGIESMVARFAAFVGMPYLPGSGIILAAAAIFIAGILMNASIFRSLYRGFESLLERIPLVKSLYGSLRDLMDFFSGEKTREMNKVVMVDLDGSGRQRILAFVTREQFDDVPEGIGGDDQVAVYLPMSYQLGGFTLIVPRSALTPIDMAMDDAMKFALTAGIKKESNGKDDAKSAASPGVGRDVR